MQYRLPTESLPTTLDIVKVLHCLILSSNVNCLTGKMWQHLPMNRGFSPHWLADQGVEMIIAGGMGQRAQDLFIKSGITVYVGAPVATPEVLVQNFMFGSLALGNNCCDH